LLDYISWVLKYAEGGIGIRKREGGSVDQMINILNEESLETR
jgi:hypothetical protein